MPAPNKPSAAKLAEYRAAIKRAYKVAGAYNEYVQGCESFLRNRGFLSAKQLAAMANVRPPRDRDEYMDELDEYEGDLYRQLHWGWRD